MYSGNKMCIYPWWNIFRGFEIFTLPKLLVHDKIFPSSSTFNGTFNLYNYFKKNNYILFGYIF